jgi:hypothetical protein
VCELYSNAGLSLQVFSAFGAVQKIAMFEKNGQTQALIQYPGTNTSCLLVLEFVHYIPFLYTISNLYIHTFFPLFSYLWIWWFLVCLMLRIIVREIVFRLND